MERRQFIRKCGVIGASCLGISLVINSCTSVHHITGSVENKKVKLSKEEFVINTDKKKSFRKYIIMRIDSSLFPIVIYRYAEDNYKAMLLRCTHQAYELNVNGDLISCTAHGSEFTSKGAVSQGPAEEELKSFPITTDDNNIYLTIG